MENKTKRVIDRITFPKKGFSICDINKFFASFEDNEEELFRLRYKIEEGVQAGEPECICACCGKAVKLCCLSKKKHIFYFKHVLCSGSCRLKNPEGPSAKTIRARQYRGAKEGIIHEKLKTLIADLLVADQKVMAVEVEKTVRHESSPRRWRRPDVLVTFRDKKLVIEIQRSRTFMSTIVGREKFYRENGIHLLWVLPSFSTDSQGQTFTVKDILYNHRRTVFVLDAEAQKISREAGELILTCYYRKSLPTEDGNEEIGGHWIKKHVRIHDLIFDGDYKVFYFDNEEGNTNCKENMEQTDK